MVMDPRNTNACLGHFSHQLATVKPPLSGLLTGTFYWALSLATQNILVDFHSVIVFDPGVGEGQGNVSLVSRPHFSCPLEKWV